MDFEAKTKEFQKLLDEGHDEQVYQHFLEQNTRFLPREHVQNHGIHLGLVLRKLAFGADYKTDFFYFSKSSDDWNAVLIELEKPTSRFFKGNTNELHADLQRALQQLNQWRAWFSVDQNKSGFLSSISAVQVPSHMARNPTHPKYVLVLGRRAEYSGNADRRQIIQALERDDFKIITFDSLAEALPQKSELIVGSRHNQFIDILSDEVVEPSLYAWMEPTQLRVSKLLQDKLSKGTSMHRVRTADGGWRDALTHAAPLVRVR